MSIMVQDIKDFNNHNEVWLEIKKLLQERIEYLNIVLGRCPKDTIWHTDKEGRVHPTRGVEFFQGKLEEILEFIDIPEKLIQESVDGKETKNEPE